LPLIADPRLVIPTQNHIPNPLRISFSQRNPPGEGVGGRGPRAHGARFLQGNPLQRGKSLSAAKGMGVPCRNDEKRHAALRVSRRTTPTPIQVGPPPLKRGRYRKRQTMLPHSNPAPGAGVAAGAPSLRAASQPPWLSIRARWSALARRSASSGSTMPRNRASHSARVAA